MNHRLERLANLEQSAEVTQKRDALEGKTTSKGTNYVSSRGKFKYHYDFKCTTTEVLLQLLHFVLCVVK